jgi:hypothetical protein
VHVAQGRANGPCGVRPALPCECPALVPRPPRSDPPPRPLLGRPNRPSPRPQVGPATNARGCTNGGVAENFGWWSDTANVTAHIASVYGYPTNDNSRAGCTGLAANTLYGAVAYSTPLAGYATTGGQPVYLPLPVCAGMSGAPVRYEQTGMVYGLLSSGSTGCSAAGRSTIGVTQITATPGPYGVNLAALVAAIP